MPVPDVDRYRPDDRRAVEALYRRVFGTDAAEASRLRWDWQYRRNPNNPGGEPEIWIAREGPAIIGQYATMPVRLAVKGREVTGSWGMDVMVAPERQRQGLGEVLFRTWDRNVGASLGLGLSDASYRLFQKLNWPDVGPVPCLVKPLIAARVPASALAGAHQPARLRAHLAARADRVAHAPAARGGPPHSAVRRQLHRAVGAARAEVRRRRAARRRVPELEVRRPRRTSATRSRRCVRDGATSGYAVYRHVHEPRGRVTLLVDFLADPDDEDGFATLLRWIDREARQADSDKIRTFAMHAGFRKC